MVYGLVQRSKEADIVIWDAANYPSLPLVNHALFFCGVGTRCFGVKKRLEQ